jgi:hypothetical protein
MKTINSTDCHLVNGSDFEDEEIVFVNEESGTTVKGCIYKKFNPITIKDFVCLQYYPSSIIIEHPELLKKEHFDNNYVKTLYLGEKNTYSKEEIFQITEKVNNYLETEFGLSIKKFKPIICDHDLWQEYSKKYDFPGRKRGVCLPEQEIALVYNQKTFITNYFHEFFGHALFFENARLGQAIKEFTSNHELNIKLMLEKYNDLTLYAFEDFLIDRNITCNLEGYAIWSEAILCQKFGFESEWDDRYKELKVIPVFPDKKISYQDLYNEFSNKAKSKPLKEFIECFFE